MKKIQYIIFLSILITSCNRSGNADLQERETLLAQKEKDFALKENEYKGLIAMRDSLRSAKLKAADTSAVVRSWPDSIAGLWNSRLICRASTCNNYVIGDQRNEQWQFMADSTGLYLKTTSKNKTMNLFKGTLQDNRITLVEQRDSIGGSRGKIQINIDLIGANLMRGTQTIQTKGDCQANFSVELTPNEK